MWFFSGVFTIISIIYFCAVRANITPICPRIPVNTGSQIDGTSLDSSCLAIDMTLNVENILPDPSYILPSSNWDIINNALTKTLNDNQITDFLISNGIYNEQYNENWSINNEQYNEKCADHKDNTVNKFHFPTIPYNMLCDDSLLNIYENIQTIECQFSMPKSLIYTWDVQSVQTLINLVDINICEKANLQAIIGELISMTGEWEILGVSNILTITSESIATSKQEFIFDTNNIILKQDTIYSLIIQVKNCETVLSIKSKPIILTYQQPNPCQLARNLAIQINNNNMLFGLETLCNQTNSIDTKKQHWSNIFYQQHSSQTIIQNYASFSRARRRIFTHDETLPFSAAIPSVDIYTQRRQLLGKPGLGPTIEGCNCGSGAGSCPTQMPSTALIPSVASVASVPTPTQSVVEGLSEFVNGLKVTLCNASQELLAPEIIFPCMKQCITIDSDTKRIFSVGGLDAETGQALNRLKIYSIKNKQHIEEINIDLQLDQPRYGSMCYYHKQNTNSREYIIVINGMNNIDDINNDDKWYNDIVFIPLDPIENMNMIINNRFPKVELTHNVIDMKPYVTPLTNELWLFGGRDGINAQNYIQTIDINNVFANYANVENKIDTPYHTFDRMEPMALDVVIPFTDFVKINGTACVMIVGGQNYVNNQWIDINIPLNGLQLYCNNIMNPEMVNGPVNNMLDLTQFDKKYVQKIDSFQQINRPVNNIYMTRYEFENNNIWYEFNVSMKVCFNNGEINMDAFNMFNNNELISQTNAILTENILMQSQINYNGWNYGYGNVYMSNINVFKNEIDDCSVESNNQFNCLQLILPNGDQKCGYNTVTGQCYSTRRTLISSAYNDDENKTNIYSYHQIIIVILMSITAVVLC